MGEPVFKSYLEQVRTRKGKLSPKTISLYLRYFRRWDGSDPVLWVHEYLRGECARGTACGLIAALRHYCEFQRIPFDPHELPMARSEQFIRKTSALTPDELDLYFATLNESGVDEPAFTVLRLLPKTGLRIHEMCSLPRNAFQKQGRQHGIKVVGKGNRQRWIPLTKSASKIMRQYIQEEAPEGGFLFPSPRIRGKHLAPDTVRLALRNLREEMPKKYSQLTPHVFRHTVATNLLSNGVDLATVQAILGHANITTTALYLHPTSAMLADAMGSLE